MRTRWATPMPNLTEESVKRIQPMVQLSLVAHLRPI